MAWSLLNHMIADKVNELLDTQKDSYGPEEERFYSREVAASIIHAAVWGYSCRSSSTAGVYAATNLLNALGLKFWSFDDEEAAALQEFRRARARSRLVEGTGGNAASVRDGNPEGRDLGLGAKPASPSDAQSQPIQNQSAEREGIRE
ncbi:hypothetical protein [Microvirga lotononidis]|uniref:Uncharacterized protein n=1 Tax=Microvirga lotononidis TaxID=864069 RepID=I4YP07_9HYPH|nr:hypothetical protein [Microvirga lotononidis]EIM25699.1 hypothetical protein MicloDRAFT_00064260 [Microvirga lotononidis]WQO25635.1 hypothetical protein U0023_13005 [Microvirga lotononidis]